MCIAAFITEKALQKAAKRFALQAAIRDYYRSTLEDYVPVVRKDTEGQPEAISLKWKATQTLNGKPLASFNVRSEKITHNRLWHESYGVHHCLLPCDGFFDKEELPKAKRYHYFSREDDEPFALAGLWKSYRGPDFEGDILSIVTTAPSADVIDIHDRMPLILSEPQWDTWLNASNRESVTPLLKVPQGGILKHWRVTDDLFKRNTPNTAALLEPIPEGPKQAELF